MMYVTTRGSEYSLLFDIVIKTITWNKSMGEPPVHLIDDCLIIA